MEKTPADESGYSVLAGAFAASFATTNSSSSLRSRATIPPYSSSDIGSIAGPKKPCFRISTAFWAMCSRTPPQKGSANKSDGSVSRPSCIENPNPQTIGQQKKVEAGVFMGTGIKGRLWLPRVSPATNGPRANAGPNSSVAGKIFCTRTTAQGSSLPTYLPAMLRSREALIDTALTGGVLREHIGSHARRVVYGCRARMSQYP